jgi:dienelactone hydrolase
MYYIKRYLAALAMPIAISAYAAQTPYDGAPINISGTIEAEDYDLGGDGVAYRDSTTANEGGAYRTDEGVEIYPQGAGYSVLGRGYDAEWQEYTISVDQAAVYSISASIATRQSNNQFRFDIDGTEVSSMNVPVTASWNTFTTATTSLDFFLDAGEHTLRVNQVGGITKIDYYQFNIANDYAQEIADIKALGDSNTGPNLHISPNVYDDSNNPTTINPGDLKAIYYDALDYQGNATRAYAWVGIPASATAGTPVPAVVLVHGGGGTAFKRWVKLWNARGYAAISIANEGQTDVKVNGAWVQHAWAGPARSGNYGDTNNDIEDQWMYHAVADTILANTLIGDLSCVDEDQVGIMGVSWGGVITSTAIGIDDRFAFAIPTYGCGHKFDSLSDYYKNNLSDNAMYRLAWDPFLRINNVECPVLWYSWPQEWHFPPYTQSLTYHAAPGVRMVSLVNNMGHSHGAAWNRPESYDFADSVIQTGLPWGQQLSLMEDGSNVTAYFTSTKTLTEANIVWTDDDELTGDPSDRTWTLTSATLTNLGSNQWQVDAAIPTGTTGYIVNAHAGSSIMSTDYQSTLLQYPYQGSPTLLSERIEAEDFDYAGEMVSYHDASTANEGNAYRPNEGVAIYTQPGGFAVVGLGVQNEWQEYTVFAETSGNYSISARVAAPTNTNGLDFDVDGKHVATLDIPNSTSWNDLQTKTAANTVYLERGEHVLRATQTGYVTKIDYYELNLQ